MRQRLIQYLKNSKLLAAFMEAPMPSWLVLLVDIMIFAVALNVIFFCNLDTTAGLNGIIYSLWFKVGLLVFAAYAMMIIYRPYRSIVRLSAFEDTYRIAKTVASWFIFGILIEILIRLCSQQHVHYFGIWNLITTAFVAFSLMVSLRIFVKSLFSIITKTGTKRRRVLVLGSAINSYAMASALLNENEGEFEPVVMLSLSQREPTNVGTLHVEPFDPENISGIFKKYNSDTVLIMSSQMEFIRNGIADKFLNAGIKMMVMNQIEEFSIDKKENARLSNHVQDIKIEDLLGRDPIVTDKSRVRNRIQGQRVMITGAAGSIGSEIVRQVAAMGASDIILVDQAETPMHDMQLEMQQKFPDTPIHLCIADVSNRQRMEKLFKDLTPRIVYHAAAYKHVPMMEHNPSEAIQTNVLGTKLVADLSLKYRVEKFVMVSTDKAVNPTNVMGASKRIAEIYVQSLAMKLKHEDNPRATKFITTRFGNVLGSNGSVIPLFRRQIAEGGPVTVTHRDIIRYFMTIPEACSLVLEAGCMGHGGEIFIFDMGEPVKIYDLATRMISLAGLQLGRDIEIVETGLRPGEKLYEELLNVKEQTTATMHKKIMIAKVRTYDYHDVSNALSKLFDAVERVDFHDVVAQMKRIVPEYVSQNSIWHAVDDEVASDEKITEVKSEY